MSDPGTISSLLHHAASAAGRWRRYERGGRAGVIAQSIHTRFAMPAGPLTGDRGALSLWVLAVEELQPAHTLAHLHKHEADWFVFPILSDRTDLRNREEANFHLRYTCDWWRNLTAQFMPMAAKEPPGYKAIIAPDHFHFHAGVWHQIALSWDRPAGRYRMWVNGIRVTASSPFVESPVNSPCGPTLYAGSTMFALSELRLLDAPLDDASAAELYREQSAGHDPSLDAALRRVYVGDHLPTHPENPAEGWREQLFLPLTSEADLARLYVQGDTTAHRVTPEGLRVETPPEPPRFAGAWTANKIENYFWTDRAFEGDICVEFDFKLHRRNGLALVMIQASGMQREDFMADHPLRTGGEMSMVCWENVRNYHWEFFREIDNCRNDVQSHLVVKNPWMAGLAYQCRPDYLSQETWHRLRWVQEGSRLRGWVDDVQIFDVLDRPDTNNGPVLSFGRVALRCKYKTAMTFANLRIRTRQIDGSDPR